MLGPAAWMVLESNGAPLVPQRRRHYTGPPSQRSVVNWTSRRRPFWGRGEQQTVTGPFGAKRTSVACTGVHCQGRSNTALICCTSEGEPSVWQLVHCGTGAHLGWLRLSRAKDNRLQRGD